MSDPGRLATLAVLAYLIGAIPFGVIATRSKGIDIFQFGSGNPGATNVARALGREWGAVVFLADVLKGLVPTVAARFWLTKPIDGIPTQLIWLGIGICAVLGHCASVFLRFRGGKGIATLLGAGVGACPVVAGAAFGIFLIVFAVTRYVSLASIVAVVSAVVLGWFLPGQAREIAVVYVAISIFVIYRHRSNIRRLLNGTEPKFRPGTSRKTKPPPERITPDEPGASKNPEIPQKPSNLET